MLKTLALVGAGLAAGLAVAFWFLPGAPSAASDFTTGSVAPVAAANEVAGSTARLASLEDALTAETDRRVELEQRVAELAAALDELRATGARADAENPRAGGEPATGEAAGPRQRVRLDPVAAAEVLERRMVERLIAAGFAPDRAEWINRRVQELRVEQMQAQYEATREGRTLDPVLAMSDRTLRNELGEADYVRFLDAQNRPTSIAVLQVLASSSAERAGLQPGDEIVTYGGTRVFDVPELNALTYQGNPGESVVVEVRRAGQPLQLVVPRGPLGITGGFRGPPMPIRR